MKAIYLEAALGEEQGRRGRVSKQLADLRDYKNGGGKMISSQID